MSIASKQVYPHTVQLANGRMTNVDGGITLREHFAAEFVKAIINTTTGAEALPEETGVAEDAVAYADALIAQLEKTSI